MTIDGLPTNKMGHGCPFFCFECPLFCLASKKVMDVRFFAIVRFNATDIR